MPGHHATIPVQRAAARRRPLCCREQTRSASAASSGGAAHTEITVQYCTHFCYLLRTGIYGIILWHVKYCVFFFPVFCFSVRRDTAGRVRRHTA